MILLKLIAASVALAQGLPLYKVPPATSVEEAYATFEDRARLVIDFQAQRDLGPFNFKNGGQFAAAMEGRLASGRDLENLNRTLLDPSSTVYSRVGTDFQDLGFLCRRTGDYDFNLRGLVTATFWFGERPELIWPATRQKLVSYFLNQRGNKVHLRNFLWLCGTHPESENHILMTESSRYLTNQLLLRDARASGEYLPDYDNEANGMTRWMLNHLQRFFLHDFSEYNSRPYQGYSVMAIQNLYEFSEDPRVKLAAEMLLNYLDAKFAVSSNQLRRWVPFRRQSGYAGRTDLYVIDGETQRFALMAGSSQLLGELPNPGWWDNGQEFMIPASLGTYRTPASILDLVIRKDHVPYFEMFRHTGLELYSSSASFLISAGGVYVPGLDYFTSQDAGIAVPTSLMPTRGGVDGSRFIRIEGHKTLRRRANICVAANFACGLNPVIPSSVPESCIERVGDWSFVDFTRAACPLPYGFYAAVYNAPCDTVRCLAGGRTAWDGTFGFFEAAEPDARGFAGFRDRILAANAGTRFRSGEPNDYVMSSGVRVRFTPYPAKRWRYGIEAYGDYRFETDAAAWPLANGNVMRADGRGHVQIDNPYLRRRISLDMSDAMNPRKSEESY